MMEEEGTSEDRTAYLHVRSVRYFQSRLSSKGIRQSGDGFLMTPSGKKNKYSLR